MSSIFTTFSTDNQSKKNVYNCSKSVHIWTELGSNATNLIDGHNLDLQKLLSAMTETTRTLTTVLISTLSLFA
jgi:deoxyxylulose-5-phosphate synthase